MQMQHTKAVWEQDVKHCITRPDGVKSGGTPPTPITMAKCPTAQNQPHLLRLYSSMLNTLTLFFFKHIFSILKLHFNTELFYFYTLLLGRLPYYRNSSLMLVHELLGVITRTVTRTHSDLSKNSNGNKRQQWRPQYTEYDI